MAVPPPLKGLGTGGSYGWMELDGAGGDAAVLQGVQAQRGAHGVTQLSPSSVSNTWKKQ